MLISRVTGCLWRLLLLAGTVTSLRAQDSVHVGVTIEGVDGPLKDNVELVLELARRAHQGRIATAQLLQLHQRAETDIGLALRPFGYYQPRVRGTLDREGDGWEAHYRIEPGPAVIVKTVNLSIGGAGGTSPEFREAVHRFPLAAGDTMRDLRYEAGKLALLTLASDSGYLDADFDTSTVLVDRGARRADILIRFDAGARFRFGAVRFEQSFLDERLLRARIPFHQGDPFRQDRLLELQTALAEDPYWERVEVTPQRSEAVGLDVPIRVVLIPRAIATYELGLGYGTDTGPRGTLTAQLRRLSRSGLHAQGDVVASPREQSVKGNLMIPAFGHPVGTLSLFGGFSRLDPQASDSRTINVGTRLDRHRTGWTQSLSLAFQRAAFEVGVDSGVASQLILGASWETVTQDDQVFPRHGLRTRIAAQGSSDRLLSNTSFLQVQGSARLIQPLTATSRVLARVEAGYLTTGDFHALPPALRFFTGGDQSVRGFAYQGLGDRDSTGHVTGGRVLQTVSLELDRQILPRWGVALFSDAGNATAHLDVKSWEQSIGAGIRFLSPVGLVRVDAAFAISRAGAPLRLHLTIGPDL